MSARHRLQPRHPKPNQTPDMFPKKHTKQKWTGPIYLPAHINKLLSQEDKDALQKYNAEAIQKFKSTRNLHEINILHCITHLYPEAQVFDNFGKTMKESPQNFRRLSPSFQTAICESQPQQEMQHHLFDIPPYSIKRLNQRNSKEF